MEGEKQNPEEGDQKKTTPELYYEENGLIVFTREYHLLRGYCCESGCRHCPFGFKKSESPQVGKTESPDSMA